jgi:hypothetical protein
VSIRRRGRLEFEWPDRIHRHHPARHVSSRLYGFFGRSQIAGRQDDAFGSIAVELEEK